MKNLGLFFVLLVIFWIAFPLLAPGYIPTHDGEFWIIRIWQYAKMMREGFIFPRWAPDLNSGYGVPLFNAYYPLPYLAGSIVYFFGFSLVDSFKLTMGFSFITAALLCFAWLRKLFTTYSATVGTLFFLSVPYWFVDLYVRGSIGEVMAVPFVISALTSIEYARFEFLAVSVAAIILSHNIAAFIFLPLIFGYTFLRKKNLLPAFIWGLTISAFFWVPAIAEQKFVLGLSNFDFRDHFPQLAQLLIPSWGTGFSRPGWPADEMSQQLGVGVVSLLSLALLYFRKNLVLPLIVSFVAAFLMLEISLPIWNLIKPLRFIQYPWRLLVVFIPLSGFFGAYFASRNRIFATIVVAVSLLISLQYARPVIYGPRSDEYYLSKHEFTDGTTTVGNSFSTVWLPWQKLRAQEKFTLVSGQATIFYKKINSLRYELQVDAQTESLVKANLSYYPGWKIDIDGKEQEISEKEGRIHFWVPGGRHTLRLRFAETPLRLASDIVSSLSLFWLIGSGILNSHYARSYRRNTARKRT